MARVHGIVLVGPFDLDTRWVDRMTGAAGFGHVAIANGEQDAQGRALAIDASTITRGIFRRPLSAICHGAPCAIVVVPHRDLATAYDAAVARIGSPYNFAGLFGRGSSTSWTCSQLVVDCLPEHLRSRVQPLRRGWPVSPNCIARCLRGEPWVR